MKTSKLKMSGIVISLAALIVACGSQVVEFPVDDSGPNKTAAPPDPGDEPCDDCQTPVDPEDDAGVTTPEDDAGQIPEEDAGTTPEDDAGSTPEEDAGQPPAEDAGGPPTEEDAGQPPPQEDAGGPPPKPTCKDKDQSGWSCGHRYGCCVSSCAHTCHRDAVKTKKQCGAYQNCFKSCQAECKAEKRACECR